MDMNSINRLTKVINSLPDSAVRDRLIAVLEDYKREQIAMLRIELVTAMNMFERDIQDNNNLIKLGMGLDRDMLENYFIRRDEAIRGWLFVERILNKIVE